MVEYPLGGGTREACGVPITGDMLIWVVVAWVYILVKIHWPSVLRSACFTIGMLYCREKVKVI